MKSDYLQQCSPILREFLGYMETVKGRSSHTMNEYFLDLRTFFLYIANQRSIAASHKPTEKSTEPLLEFVDADFLRTITLLDVYEFMNHIKNENGNNARTRARKTTALRVFFRYLTDYAGILESNPLQNLDTPKAKKSLPKFLSLEQSMELLQSVQGDFAKRDYCILTFFLNLGIRRAELAAINLHDIRPDGTLRILGKGNKERIVYLNDACRQALEAYLKVRPVDGVIDRDALFLSAHKQRISLQGVYYIVKGYFKRLPGLEEYSPHKLRHTAATLMYQGGTDIRVLKDLLGHETLNTTEIYTHLQPQQIQAAIEKNPLSKIRPPSASETSPNKKA